MSPLLNLPLGLAALATLWLDYLIWLAPARSHNYTDGFVLLLAAMVVGGLRWLLLTVVLGRCAARGRLGWLPVRGAALWSGHIGVGILSGVCLLVAVLSSAAIGDDEFRAFNRFVLLAARVGCTVPALVLTIQLALAVNAGAGAVDGGTLRAASLAAVLSGLIGATTLGGAYFVNEARHARQTTEREQDHAAARAAEDRRRFATLTDADPLLTWDQFVGANMPPDLSAEAFRRLAARPTLEADLIAALQCRCDNPLWAAELLWLIPRIPFTPSPALGGAVRDGIAILTVNIRDSAAKARPDERDGYIDVYLAGNLATVRDVTVRMATAAHVDLGAELDGMRRAVLEAYPRSHAARSFPGEVDAALKQIRAAMGGS